MPVEIYGWSGGCSCVPACVCKKPLRQRPAAPASPACCFRDSTMPVQPLSSPLRRCRLSSPTSPRWMPLSCRTSAPSAGLRARSDHASRRRRTRARAPRGPARGSFGCDKEEAPGQPRCCTQLTRTPTTQTRTHCALANTLRSGRKRSADMLGRPGATRRAGAPYPSLCSARAKKPMPILDGGPEGCGRREVARINFAGTKKETKSRRGHGRERDAWSHLARRAGAGPACSSGRAVRHRHGVPDPCPPEPLAGFVAPPASPHLPLSSRPCPS